ncbi:MAG TPA: AMP-binding protein [Thermovirgaceae bacterium]|nr:AMP-binding protein [Thermovirgaceae bacterium]
MKVRLEETIISKCKKSNGERAVWWRGAWWSRKVLADLIMQYEEKLRESGFGEGDRIAALMPNCPAFLALMVAVWKAGGTLTPLNLQAGMSATMDVLRHSDVSAAFVPQGMDQLAEGISASGIPAMAVPLDGALPSFKSRKSEPSDPDIAVLFYTSGTTGLPKGVPISHSNLHDNVSRSIEHFKDLADDDIFVNVLPNFHTLGFTTSGLLPLLGGFPQALVPTFMPPETAIESIKAADVSVMIAVPTMVALMLGAIARGTEAPTSLRLLATGGDRFPEKLDGRTQQLLGVSVLEGYGLTETSPVVSLNEGLKDRKLGTVGRVLKGYEVEIRDMDGNVLPVGKEGTLWLKGPSVFNGYFRAPEITAQKFKDGWFNTGDVVRMDEDGYLTIVDRLTDIAIVGGFNVYPTEVEAVIQQLPGVRESAVVGVKHPVSGEIVKAYVIPTGEPAITSRDVISFCRDKLAHYKVPRSVEFIEEMPRSSIGKILKRELRKR